MQISPQLAVRRGRSAIAFYEQAFGAVVEYQVGATEGHESVVAQLSAGGATFWAADEAPEHGTHSPESLGGATVRLLLLTDDPDGLARRAIAAGATELTPVGEVTETHA